MDSKRFRPGRGYTKQDWDEVSDNPDWTEEDLKAARPFAEVFPEMAEAIRKRGPARTKTAVSIRLDDDLVAALRATGPGWQGRVNDALREWVKKSAA